MMFVDAWAMVAMLADETEGERLARILEGADNPITSAIAIYETTARLMSKSTLSGQEARQMVADFLSAASIRVVMIGEREADIARQAFERFGKRRHSANLNMGDCFVYACAKANRAHLLFIGDDFSQTDVNALEG
jgi:ribonuclease VapC